MNSNDEVCNMFVYVGRGRWKSITTDWTSEELATLYYCLHMTLDETEMVDIRHDIVWLMEKLFNESENHDPINELRND